MDPRPHDEKDISLAMQRVREATEAPTEGAKKAVNMKALAGVLALAVVAGGTIYAVKRNSAPKADSQQMKDSLSWVQKAGAQAAGYDATADQQFSASSGLQDDTSGAEARLRALQDAARTPQQQNAAEGPGGASQGGARATGNEAGSGSGSRGSSRGQSSAQVVSSVIPEHLRIRLNPEYQQWLEMHSGTTVAWSRPESDGGVVRTGSSAPVAGVDPALQNLYPGAQPFASAKPFYMPASAEITCVTDHVINTDYAGVIRATVTSPQELKGARVLLNHTGVNIDRANASIGTLVMNRGGSWSQYAVQGVVRTDLPALNGIVNHHYMRRIMPAVANAGLAGGALYLSGNNTNNNISTSDQIYNSMVVAGISGVQTEIAKINDGKPEVTVVVPAGQEFNILLTSGLEIK